MGFTIPLRAGGFIELPPDITTREQLWEWEAAWAKIRPKRNRAMTRRASRRYPR